MFSRNGPKNTFQALLLVYVLTLISGLTVVLGATPGSGRGSNPGRPKGEKPAAAGRDPVQVIDEQIRARWKLHRLVPSRRATDYEFIRRVSLDVIGRIASPEEVARFLRDPPPTRRRQLIDRLLASEDYARNWSNIWTVWLLTRSAPEASRGQLQGWLRQQFSSRDQGIDRIVTDLLTATGKGDVQPAVNFLLAQKGELIPADRRHDEGYAEFLPATSRAMRLLLGLQIQCAQCHDHPFNPLWKQKDFWGVNAFFRQVRLEGIPSGGRRDSAAVLGISDDPKLNPEGAVFYEERRGTVLMSRPEFLDGRRMAPELGLTRRQALAQFITSSPYFARAQVNRLWAHFFGRGFTHPGPPDDFGEHNPVTHPLLPDDLVQALKQAQAAPAQLIRRAGEFEDDHDRPRLLDYLAETFRQHGHDPRAAIRWICNSEAYQLASVANGTNDHAEADPYFSRMALKALSPEQLFESLMMATRADADETPDARRRLREAWTLNLIVNFGDDEGNEGSYNGTVVQALQLMNGREVNEAIANREKGTVSLALGHRGQRAALDRLFMAALNRPATEREYRTITHEIGLAQNGTVRARDAWSLWQDAFWAILNSNEFILNH